MNKILSSDELIVLEKLTSRFVTLDELKELNLKDLDLVLLNLSNSKLIVAFKGISKRYSISKLGKQTLSKQPKQSKPIKVLYENNTPPGVPPIEKVNTIKTPIKSNLANQEQLLNQKETSQVVLDRLFKLYKSDPDKAFRVLATMVLNNCQT